MVIGLGVGDQAECGLCIQEEVIGFFEGCHLDREGNWGWGDAGVGERFFNTK